MRPLLTSLPVRTIESSDSVTGPKPLLTTTKGIHGQLKGRLLLRSTPVLGTWRFGWPVGMMTSMLAGPPAGVARQPQGERFRDAPRAGQETVDVPSGKVAPDRPHEMTVTPERSRR